MQGGVSRVNIHKGIRIHVCTILRIFEYAVCEGAREKMILLMLFEFSRQLQSGLKFGVWIDVDLGYPKG